MSFIEKLNERYATKAMNGKVVPQEKIDTILEAIRLAPTSSGLQPFEVLVVTNDKIKASIKEIAWNQEQVTDCSHLLVFAAWDNYTEDRINHMFDLTNEIRGFENQGWEDYRKMLLGHLIRNVMLNQILNMLQDKLILLLWLRLHKLHTKV